MTLNRLAFANYTWDKDPGKGRRDGRCSQDLLFARETSAMRSLAHTLGTNARSRGGRCIHHYFEQQVLCSPQSIAVDSPEGPITYQQLNARADQIARQLSANGVKRGDRIVAALHRSVDAIAAFAGILKAGAAYCPLDLSWPPARLKLILHDTQPPTILTTTDLKPLLPPFPAAVLSLDALDDADGHLDVESDVNDAACVMYTSGSTGQPKGALIAHRGIVRLFFGSDYLPFGPKLRTLAHSPMHFDASTFELWAPLLHGGACVVFPGGMIPTLHELRAAIREFKVNCLFLGPATFNLIIEEDPKLLGCLEYVLVGGEAMSVRHTRLALQQLPETRLLNVYGPTETTTFATCYSIPANLPADARSVPIGTPIAETACYVLDPAGQPVADGSVGELFIGGDAVALGYLNRPQLTEEYFLPDSFKGESSARMYRTGDLCRRLADGNLDFVGRVDHQVKISGHRIELGEIEAVLQEHPDVLQSIVVVHQAGEERNLVGYYTLGSEATCSPEQLREHLQARLPAYLVPRWLVHLPRMPVNENGKVDRSALPRPDLLSLATGHAARTDLEETLTALWRQSLQNPRIGIDDSFFALGGTSLGALRLCSQIERTTGRFVPIATLYLNNTPSQMAKVLSDDARRMVAQLTVPLNSGKDGTPLFCVPGQRGTAMTFRDLSAALATNHPVYCLQFPGLDGVTEPASTVEATATQFSDEIRRLYPDGPVHLLGYSYGGVVAYELARQLRKLARPVGKLILVDAFTRDAISPKPLVARLITHARQLVRYGPRHTWTNLMRRRLREEVAASVEPVPADAQVQLHERVWQLNFAAFYAYDPGPYAGDVVCIRCLDDPRWLEFVAEPVLGGWRHLVSGRFDVHRVAGEHLTLWTPKEVNVVADIVRRYLDIEETGG
jgi:amino acid adenylation domain-containing protein